MNEDKLSHDERLRLECLTQAIASVEAGTVSHPFRGLNLIDLAIQFEEYVREGEKKQ
jgi:hypothetical protein